MTMQIKYGDKSTLNIDQRDLLENTILPTARRWLDIPGLAHHGASTLMFWGENPTPLRNGPAE